MEVAPADEDNAQWGAYSQNVTGTNTEIGYGRRNTKIIVNFLGTNESNRAAQLCNTKSNGGTYGWFLPSQDELSELCKIKRQYGIPSLVGAAYWSSSQNSTSTIYAWTQDFSDGTQYHLSKYNTLRVRAVRAF